MSPLLLSHCHGSSSLTRHARSLLLLLLRQQRRPPSTTTTTSTRNSSTLAQQLPDDSRRRRGFGGRVVPGAADELQQVVVAATPADEPLTLRAYHVGSRVHIGQLLTHVRSNHPDCRITADKDHCIIWLAEQSAGLNSLQSSPLSRLFVALRGSLFQQQQQHAQQQPQPQPQPQEPPPPPLAPQQQQQQQVAAALTSHTVSTATGAASGDQASTPNDATGSSNSSSGTAQAALPAQPPSPHQQPQPPPEPGEQQQQQLPLMAVYRSGSVVFAGLPEREDIVWLGHLVPPSVRYTGEERGPWLQAFLPTSVLPAVTPKEVHRVVVDPNLPAEAEKGDDELRLRVLDVGAVRVLTAVLAQSAALHIYEQSINNSLKRLSDWRAAHAARSGSGSSGGSGLLSGILASTQDKVLFKVIAASALVLSQAQELLRVAEPAWQYHAYSTIWGVMAKDYELEARLHTLEVKLHQIETEAKHDVKTRAGRRSRKLEQSIVWLLVASCMLALVESLKKGSLLLSRYSSSAGPDSEEEGVLVGADASACDAAAAAAAAAGADGSDG